MNKFGLLLLVFVSGMLGSLVVVGGYNWSKQETYYNSYSYTAVFLDNDQVYFGRVELESDLRLILTDVYYLKASAIANASDSAQLSLIKLGEELHGPKDRMVINREHVLFYEEMRNDGTIMDSIIKRSKG